MISKPQPSEIRETTRSFNEVYESLTSFEKSNFHQIINSFKTNVTKKDWAHWLKKKRKAKLDKESASLRLFVKIILVFTLVALPAIFFTIAGDRIASLVVFIAIYFVLFADVITTQNSMAMLEIEIDKIDVEIVTIEKIIESTSMHIEIRNLFDAFFKCYESDGRYKAQEAYMPSISLAIATMIKESKYQLDSDVFF
jgi:hypothetical protein